MKRTLLSLALATTALASVHATAYEPGDMFLRFGTATVAPDASSEGVAIPALGIDPISGTGVDVDNNTQLGLTFTYMLGTNVGIEVLAATPFSHDITASLGAAGLPGIDNVSVGDTRHLPPTVSAVWYPMGSREAFKPYLGAGINYTTFFDTSVSSELKAGVPAIVDIVTEGAVNLPSSVPLDMDLDDSFGVALQAGVDYDLNEKWMLNASVRWINISTDATITNPDLGTVITVNNVDIDPWVYQLNVGYKF